MTPLGTVDAKLRPFYIIGNMVNSPYDVDVFLKDGKYKGQLALLYLILKTSGLSVQAQYRAGVAIARKIMGNLWKDVDPAYAVPVLLYVSRINQKNVFRGVLDTITPQWRNYTGFDFGGTEPLTTVSEVFAQLNITGHRWLGTGTYSCAAYEYGQYKRLEDIVDCREGHIPGCNVDKGYAYNLDRKHNIAREIRLGLDGLHTNWPSTVREVLQWDDISRIVRLATTDDNPWERVLD